MGEGVTTRIQRVETDVRVVQESLIERHVIEAVQQDGVIVEGTVAQTGVVVQIVENVVGRPMNVRA